MKGTANIIAGIHCMKQAFEHFASFQREHPNTKGDKLFKQYNSKLEWIYTDLKTHPFLTDEVRQGITNEWESDVFAIPAIAEQVSLLNPQQRELVETIVESMLNGEEIKFEKQ